MTPPPVDLLRLFHNAVSRALDDTTEEMIRYTWAPYVGSAGRTVFYCHSLWPRVARLWDPPLSLRTEYRGVDHAFLNPSSGQIAILAESENKSEEISSKELTRLCEYGAPLSVIATCMEWEGHPQIDERKRLGERYRKKFSDDWQRRITTLCAGLSDERLFCFIIAEGYPETEKDVTPDTGVYFGFSALAFNAVGEMVGEGICPPRLHQRPLPYQSETTDYYLSAIPIG